MPSRLCMAALVAGIALSASADSALGIPIPEVPESRMVDTESTVFVAVTNGVPGQTEFGFDLDFYGTSSNNVEVALGQDGDGDGELSFSETDLVVGWDCGRYFVDRPLSGIRYSSGLLPESGSRTLHYECGMSGLGSAIRSFVIRVPEGVMCPTGLVSEALYDGTAGLWEETFAGSVPLHRLRIELWRYYGWGDSAHLSVGNLSLSDGLRALRPSGVGVQERVVPRLFGMSSRFVLYSSGDVSAYVADDLLMARYGARRAGMLGVYLDTSGMGTLGFRLSGSGEGVYAVVCVDGVRVGSYYGGDVSVAVGGGGAYPWVWRTSWDVMRVTRRGLDASVPGGVVTLRQRGGMVQLL